MIPVPDSDQIGMLDLLEGVAVLESFKLCTEHADVNHFLQFRDRHFGGSERSVYRWSFNWLADAIGADGTYELLAPVSFLALQSTDPSREFTQIVKQLARVGRRDYQKLADIETLSATLYPRGWKSWLEAFANGEPTSGHVTLDKCAAFAVGQLGVRQATQLAATPSRVTAETFAALCPPVTAYSGEESVTLTIPDYARNGLAEAVIDWTAIVGAAERLTMLTDVDVYQFCPHTGCPHYESALCHRVFAPPGVNSQHERCRFPATFRTHARLEPRDAWTAVGRQRKSLADVIAEFEETYEAGLLALARRERASLVGWLGEDAYNNIEGKCQATAEKAMRALRTQKINDVIEARAFRDAVVAELRRLYATVSESA
jgi:hypothetical protein